MLISYEFIFQKKNLSLSTLFLLIGFQYEFLKRRKKADNSTLSEREGKELLLVTSCSDSIELNSLTYTQIAGVFLNYYCSDISLEVKQILFVL